MAAAGRDQDLRPARLWRDLRTVDWVELIPYLQLTMEESQKLLQLVG